jgi:hypothetical protein
MNDEELFPRHNDPYYLPKGEYKVIFDGKVLGVFPSLDEAQAFQCTLGYRGSTIQSPDLRKKMNQSEIDRAMKVATEWGKDEKNEIKPISPNILDRFKSGSSNPRYR